MSKFNGYRITTTNIRRVEKILQTAQNNIREVCIDEFHKLLAAEVANVVDDYTLGVIQNLNRSILDIAADHVFHRIRFAEAGNRPTEYNFYSSVQLLPDRDTVYMILNCQNPVLEEAFASTPEIEHFDVGLDPNSNAENEKTQTERSKKWLTLQERYKDAPIILYANFSQRLSIDTELLSKYFVDKTVRAKNRATREMWSRLFNMYACGEQVPSEQVMYVFEFVLNKFLDPRVEAETRALEQRLLAILPDITLEMIDPKETVQQSDPNNSANNEKETAS